MSEIAIVTVEPVVFEKPSVGPTKKGAISTLHLHINGGWHVRLGLD